jgi:uncharacterized protein (DUF1800 family)
MSAAAFSAKRQPLTIGEAGRQLRRCTLGQTYEQIQSASGQRFDQWIDSQFALPFVAGQAATTMSSNRLPGFAAGPALQNGGEAHAKLAQFLLWKGHQPEVLRTRLTWALWELFSVGGAGTQSAAVAVGFGDFWDVLESAVNSGTWRSLIEEVTLTQLMSQWLTYYRNAKSDGVRQPDENYAREIMQLYSIGLWELREDGTRKLTGELDPGDPRYVASGTDEVPTYQQADITNVARIFTGMIPPVLGTPIATVFGVDTWRSPGFSDYDDGAGRTGWRTRLTWSPTHHETTLAKQALYGLVNIPVGTDGPLSLAMFLAALETHPSTAPFFCKAMIRLLVTSNPSPAYVHRVVSVFKNDGTGQIGNLRAVFKAILTDQEALAPVSKGLTMRAASFEEHIFQQIFSTAPALTVEGAPLADGAFAYPGTTDIMQYGMMGMPVPSSYSVMQNPSVFGRWPKEYKAPGEIFNNGLVSPEMATLTEGSISTLMGTGSPLNQRTSNKASAQDRADCTNAANHAALVDRWCVTLAGNRPDATFRSELVSWLGTRTGLTTEDNRSETLRGIIYSIMQTPWANVRT